MSFFKKDEATYSGTVERIGVIQESSLNGRTCYALLLKGESQPRIVDTKPNVFDPDGALMQLRTRIALTAPGDSISVKTRGGFTVEFRNITLEQK